jgi:hypothetical protein
MYIAVAEGSAQSPSVYSNLLYSTMSNGSINFTFTPTQPSVELSMRLFYISTPFAPLPYMSFTLDSVSYTQQTGTSSSTQLVQISNKLKGGYRFGYNGQEKVDEIAGAGNHTTAEFWEYDTRLGRRWNRDPKPNPSVSDYACFNNNPIWNTDVLGDKPTPKQAAAMAAHVYGDKSDKILKGGWKVSGKDFGIEKNNSENGLHSQVYERNKRGKTEYVYASAGTEDMTDAKQDALQLLGLSGQYDISMNNATKISDKLGKGTELTFTGHSLGGGEAAANAYKTGRDAITFNAAGVSPLTKMENSRSKVDAYILMTDPLNAAQNNSPALPDVNGTRHYLIPRDVPSLYNGHSMDNVLKSFEINPSLYQKSK